MKKKILFISLSIVAVFMTFMPIVFAGGVEDVTQKASQWATTAAENLKGDRICTVISPNVVIDDKIPNLVHTIILIIQIAVPVVLIILGMLDLFKAMTSGKDDEMKKAQGLFVKRLISAALVFFVIAIVKLVFSVIGENNTSMWNCIDCFLEGTDACRGKQ